MDKELFLSVVYKNKLFIKINNHISYIHNKIYKQQYEKLNWNQLIESPTALSHYGYLDQFKNLVKLKKERSAQRALSSQPYDSSDLYIERCAIIAARYGHIDLLKYIIECFKIRSYQLREVFASSLRGGQIPIIEYLYSLSDLPAVNYIQMFHFTAQSGRIEVCEWFINHFREMNLFSSIYEFYCKATLSGSLDILNFAIQFFNNKDVIIQDDRVWRNALRSNNIKLLDFMLNHSQFQSSFKTSYWYQVILYSNIKVVDWFFSKCDDTASFDMKQVLEALIDRGSRKTIKYFSNRYNYKIENHKNEAEWLFNSCQHHGFNAIDAAIINGENNRFRVMKWIYENTDFQGRNNPLEISNYRSYDKYLDLLEWFTENNRTERIPTGTLDILLSSERYFKIVEYIIRNRSEQFPNQKRTLLDYVLLASQSMELVNWLIEKKQESFSNTIMNNAIASNKLEVVKWIHENTTFHCSKSGVASAYFLQDRSMVEWLNRNRTETCDSETIKKKFSLCSKEVQAFIIYKKPDMVPLNVWEYIYNYSSLLKYIIDRYPPQIVHDYSLLAITYSGNVEMVKYLYEYFKRNGINKKTNHFNIDVFKRSLQLAITKASFPSNLNNDAQAFKDKKSYIDIAEYLCENGPKIKLSTGKDAKCDFNAVDLASSLGSLEIVKYLVENGCKGTNQAIDSASALGYLEIIKYLREHHHKCTPKSIKGAIVNSHINVVEWLLENILYQSDSIPTDIQNDYIRSLVIKYKQDIENRKRKSNSWIDFILFSKK